MIDMQRTRRVPTALLRHGLHAAALSVALFGAGIHGVSAQVTAAPADSLDGVVGLAPIVVTASGSGVDVRNAPASVSVITRQELERQPVQSIGEVLARLPGVTGGLSPTGEMSKIKLRGLPDNYTLLLVNGRRIGTSRDVNYRPDMGRQDLNWISPEMIERIEVVRGPMSALYGSDAMGGVVNIITRPITPAWRGAVTSNYTLPGRSERGDAYQFTTSFSGPITPRLGLKFGAGYTRQNPDDMDIDGGLLGSGGVSDRTANAELRWNATRGHVLSLEGSYGLQEALAPSVPDSAGELQAGWGATELTRVSFRAGYEGVWAFGTTRLDVYQNRYDNEVGEDGRAEVEDLTVEGAVNGNAVLVVPHALTVGGQYRREELTNTRTIGTVPVDYAGTVIDGATLDGFTAAVFAEDQMALRPNLLLTAGARMDSHEKYGEHLSPRVYLVYHPVGGVTVRGGVSRGFRAPTLKENSGGAATFSRGNGCRSLADLGYTTGGCYMAGNPELEPEESTNYEVGVGYDRARLNVGVTYFTTDFENKIEYAPLGYYQGYWWTRMENVEHARTEGLEGTAAFPLARTLTLRANGTWMIEAKNLDTGEELITTPEFSGFSSLDWRTTDRVSLSLSAQYTGRQLGPADVITEGYTMVDQAASLRVSEQLTLRAGVQNLFDATISSTSGFDYYQPGRRFFAGVTSRF